MANVDATTSNHSNHCVGDDAALTMTASRVDSFHSLYKTLVVVKVSVGSVILSVMLISNFLTLYAVWMTPHLRVKAYALTTSLTATNALWSVVQIDWLVRAMLRGATPCSFSMYRFALRPIKRWIAYATYLHISVIAVDRYIAAMHSLHYENRVIQR